MVLLRTFRRYLCHSPEELNCTIDRIKKIILLGKNGLLSPMQYGCVSPCIAALGTVDELASVMRETDREGDAHTYRMLDEEKKEAEARLMTMADKQLRRLAFLDEGTMSSFDQASVEIKAGVGGQESMLFAENLLELYCALCSNKGWKYSIIDVGTTELGGCRHANLTVSGEDALTLLSMEAGVHRVQRVPATERAGRMHTSTVAVAVVPFQEQEEIHLGKEDLKMWTFASRGPGGQHANKTSSGVRLQHIPTGVSVTRTSNRLQFKNKEEALEALRETIEEHRNSELDTARRTRVKAQMGHSNRNEKIRTYNFPQDRVTDHRIPFSIYDIKQYLNAGSAYAKMTSALSNWSVDQWIKAHNEG